MQHVHASSGGGVKVGWFGRVEITHILLLLSLEIKCIY